MAAGVFSLLCAMRVAGCIAWSRSDANDVRVGSAAWNFTQMALI